MKKIFFKNTAWAICCASLISLSHAAFGDMKNSTTSSEAQTTPAGYWQTIDDVTNLPRSIVKICQLNDKKLYGRIIQVNYRQNEGPQDICNLCGHNDPRYNQLNLGMIILEGLEATPYPTIWDDGKVLDPVNGKVYDAKITLAPDGKSMTLRGYIGISLLGRSQTWTRIDSAELEKQLGKPLKKNLDGYYRTTQGKYVAEDYTSCDAMQTEFNQMTASTAANSAKKALS
ncbi:MAG: hypothetical protein K0S08_882 [Gammaproteobacteria bacterium]|jgi:uncharacterized protein (DUF2147 family)|nr:hypothetical protein [Gammaproteobacteria bacterium]